MASGPNPMAAMVLRALQGQTGGGAPGMGGMPGQGPQAANPGDEYAQQVSQLKGADPGGLLRQLKAMKEICAVMLVQNLERLPNVAGKLGKLIPQFDGVIKEVQQAANVNAAVRNPSPPIQMGAAMPSPQAPNEPSGMPMGGGF